MLTLAIGDLYIPERSVGLPSKFRKLLCPNPSQVPSNSKISDVICLGNITNSNETLRFLHNLSGNFHLVKGEHDDVELLSQQLKLISNSDTKIPLYNVITHDNLKIGFTNGFQIVPKNDPLGLSALARELDVDVLVWGGTHKVEAYTLDGKFFINPGSATGAFTFDWPDNDDDDDDDVPTEELEHEKATEKNENRDIDEENENNDDKKPQEKSNETDQEKDDTKPEEAPESSLEKKTEKNDSAQVDQELLTEVEEANSVIPSFCLLETQGSVCTLYIYTYLNNEVKVDKVTYTKD